MPSLSLEIFISLTLWPENKEGCGLKFKHVAIQTKHDSMDLVNVNSDREERCSQIFDKN